MTKARARPRAKKGRKARNSQQMTESVPLTDIVHWTTAEVSGDPPKAITQLASLNEATHSQLSVYLSKRWKKVASTTNAGAVLVERANITDLPSSTALLIVEDARAAWHHVIEAICGLTYEGHRRANIKPNAVIHPTANVSPPGIDCSLCCDRS